jgi:pimeloyl-ACP methyl ester carboxylesterase
VRWAIVPGAGHTLPEEVPDRVNAAVVEAARPRPVRDAVASSVAMG